jgi:hypothetical protein
MSTNPMSTYRLFDSLRNVAIHNPGVSSGASISTDANILIVTEPGFGVPAFGLSVQVGGATGQATLIQEGNCTSYNFCQLLLAWRILVDAHNMSCSGV